MRVRSAKQAVRQAYTRATDRAEGRGHSLTRLSASRQAARDIADLSKLPTAPSTLQLQNAAGVFYFLLGYSGFDGGDILAP